MLIFLDQCGDNCAVYNENYFVMEAPGIGRPVLFMSIQGLVFFGILFLIESHILTGIWQRAISDRNRTPPKEEELRARSASIQMSQTRHHVEVGLLFIMWLI